MLGSRNIEEEHVFLCCPCTWFERTEVSTIFQLNTHMIRLDIFKLKHDIVVRVRAHLAKWLRHSVLLARMFVDQISRHIITPAVDI